MDDDDPFIEYQDTPIPLYRDGNEYERDEMLDAIYGDEDE